MDKSIYLFNNGLKLCHIFSTSSGNKEIYNTKYYSDLDTGAETFDGTIPVEDTYADDLVEGSYIGFYWKNKFKLMQIKKTREVEQIIGTHREIKSEFVGIGLLNNYVRPFSITGNMTTLLKTLLNNTNYKIGYISPTLDDIVATTEITEITSIYTILQDVIDDYGGCEWEFGCELKNSVNGDIEFNLSCYGNGERGTPTYKRFIHDLNIQDTEKSGDITEYCAGLIGVGANGITFKECEWHKAKGDPIDKPLGDDFILDANANDKLNNGGTPIFNVYKSDATTQIDLLWETYRKLQEINKVKFKYVVPVVMPDIEYEEIDVGDTVYAINDKFTPPIQLEARISSFNVSFTEGTGNTCELSNYREVRSKIKNIDRNAIIKDTVDELTGFSGKLTQADIDAINRYLESLDLKAEQIDKLMSSLDDNIIDEEVPVVDVPSDTEDYSKIYVKTTDGGLWIGGSRIHDIVKYGCGDIIANSSTTTTTNSKEYADAVAYYKKFSLGTKANTAAMDSLISSTNKYKISTVVKYWAGKFGLDPYLVYALIMAESSGNPLCNGAAYGLMQCEKSVYFNKKQTITFLDGTTKSFTPTLSNMKVGGKVVLNGVTVDSGVSNQIMVGCNELRKSLVRFKFNIFAALMGYNFGVYGADWVICKYVATKNNLSFVSKFGYTVQSSKVQALYFKELETYQASWSNLRTTYVSTFRAGTATNIEYYLRYYKSVNGQLPYVLNKNGVKCGYGAKTPTKTTTTTTTTTTTNTTFTPGVATSKRNIIVAKAKEIVNLHQVQKLATYDQLNRIVDDSKRFKAKGTIYGVKTPYCYDCSSFVSCAYLAAGFSSVYAKTASGGTLVKGATSQSGYSMWKVDTAGISKALPGDIVMDANSTVTSSNLTASNMSLWGKTHHTMIYIGNGQVAHASRWAYVPNAIKISDITYYKNKGTAFFLRPWDLAKADKEATTTTTTTTSKPTTETIQVSYESVFKGVPNMNALDIVSDNKLIQNINVGGVANNFALPKTIPYAFIDFDITNLSQDAIQATINLIETIKTIYPKVPIFIAKQMKVNSNYSDYVNVNTLIDNYNTQLLAYANKTQYVVQIDISSGLVTNSMINTSLSTNGFSFKDKVSAMSYYNNCKKYILSKAIGVKTPVSTPPQNIKVTLNTQKTYNYTSPVASIEFLLPTVVPDEYYTKLVFSTKKNTEPTKFVQSSLVYLDGTDCKNGVLVPKADTKYTLTIFKSTDNDVTTKKYYGLVGGIANGGKYKDFATFKGGATLATIAKTYYDNRAKLIYNSTTPADYSNPGGNVSKWVTNGRMHIDDSTFLNFCLMGLAYKESPYGNTSMTKISKNSKYSWSMSSIRSEANIGKYFVEQGWVFYDADLVNFSNIEAGDVLFMDPSGYGDVTQFMGINHIAIVTGPNSSGVMQVLECANIPELLKYSNISDYKTKNVLFIGRIRKD